MSSSPSLIQCPNPTCLYSENALGRRLCDRCQTPLVYRYLWAVGAGVEQIPAGTQIANRYTVVSPQVWLDATPGAPAEVSPDLPDVALPYLRLYSERLHVPEIYGFCQLDGHAAEILLLDNVPIDRSGQPLPGLGSIWVQVSPVRQVYWLWQIFQLWVPLQQQGVASSLVVPDNIRVEGWRVRLRQLYSDGLEIETDDPTITPPTLKDLSEVWLKWAAIAAPTNAPKLQEICQLLQSASPVETIWRTVSTELNQLLLEQAAQLPLRLRVFGATATGPQRSHNEDTCYPLPADQAAPDPMLQPHLAVICDGIGGHAGGEVASQLAVRSLQLQLRALLVEIAEQTEIVAPEVILQQLEAIVRVVNNVISAQNDEQGRESRQRMGTTLVLAFQLPQKIANQYGSRNAHELYLAHVGDSRAYWITPRYCHQLTVDDDVAAREVRMGRSLYQESLKRADSGALTQALGTRDAETIRPTVKRFILEEEGVLLLCSDGLSDNGLVERSWEQTTRSLFKGKASLEQTAQTWIDLANQQNGHDNASVVLLHCQVSSEEPQLFDPKLVQPATSALSAESSLSEASRALLYDEEATDAEPVTTGNEKGKQLNTLALAMGLLVFLVIIGGLGLFSWRQLDPIGFGQTWERILGPSQPQTPPSPDS